MNEAAFILNLAGILILSDLQYLMPELSFTRKIITMINNKAGCGLTTVSDFIVAIKESSI